jgi:UDP-N-acetylmuramyl pentapeptide phosphotransferase/UDP-N-acetylglucosamine-1-phosphate transferase
MLLLFTFLTSLLLVLFSVPSIINLALRKGLFDNPNVHRKIHKHTVPNFGGIAIFTGFIFSCCLFIQADLLPEANRLMAGGLILFMIGLNDDLLELGPKIKFLVQFTSALIVSVAADVRIHNLQGFLGFYELDYLSSILFTVFVIVGIVNAFNLIDGIDGLAASLGITLTVLYAYLFWHAGHIGWACLSISLTGALLGFLFFNITPARIFMGDSGSLLLGFIAVVLSIKFIDISSSTVVQFGIIDITSGLALVVAILIIPIFDTARVFILRVLRNTSPFKADSNHLHHRLLFLGLSHMQSTLILVFINILFILMAVSLQNLNNTQLISVLILTILTVNGLFSLYVSSYKRNMLSRIPMQERPAASQKSFADEVLENISEN